MDRCDWWSIWLFVYQTVCLGVKPLSRLMTSVSVPLFSSHSLVDYLKRCINNSSGNAKSSFCTPFLSHELWCGFFEHLDPVYIILLFLYNKGPSKKKVKKMQQIAEELHILNKMHATYLQEQRSSHDSPRRIWRSVAGLRAAGCRRHVAVHTHWGRSPCWKHRRAQTCGYRLSHRSWWDTHTLLPHTLHPTDIPHPGTSLKNTTDTIFTSAMASTNDNVSTCGVVCANKEMWTNTSPEYKSR